MLDVETVSKLVQEWFESVPEDMRDKVVAASFSIKPLSFTPRQVLDRVNVAAKKTKTREEFIKEVGVCAEFVEVLERLSGRRQRRGGQQS